MKQEEKQEKKVEVKAPEEKKSAAGAMIGEAVPDGAPVAPEKEVVEDEEDSENKWVPPTPEEQRKIEAHMKVLSWLLFEPLDCVRFERIQSNLICCSLPVFDPIPNKTEDE